jgi:hypothetical protein
MVLQLTSLLDLLLIIVFVQYLEMRQASAVALARQARSNPYLELRRADVYDVWQIHLNGNRSTYTDGSVTIASAEQRLVFEPRDAQDFLNQLIGMMMFSPRPGSPCIFLLTYGNVRRDALSQIQSELAAASKDRQLQEIWSGDPVQFVVADGGYVKDSP